MASSAKLIEMGPLGYSRKCEYCWNVDLGRYKSQCENEGKVRMTVDNHDDRWTLILATVAVAQESGVVSLGPLKLYLECMIH